jgi:hypothetical protein
LKCASCSLLFHLLDDLGGDSVHVGDALGGKGFAHGHRGTFLRLEFGSADEASALQLNEAVADVFTSGLSEVFSAGSVVLVATVVLTESVDTNLLSHVDLVSNGGGTVVKPVTVIGGELLEAASLSVLSPL